MVAPLITLWNLAVNILPALRPSVWNALTDPQSQAYHPLWGTAILFELVGSVAMLSLFGLVIPHFFKKRRAAPRLVIALLIAQLIYLVLDVGLGSQIPAVASETFESYRRLVQSFVSASIWVPYFLISKRVRVTFVH